MKIPRSFRLVAALLALAVAGWSTADSAAQEPFSKLVGSVRVEPVKDPRTLEVPFIIWGGDVATFHANGGLQTKPGTIFAKHGLDLKLRPGDDFVGQVKRYLAGQTPFLRGTFRMIGLASEVVGADSRTRPVVFLQMTWSAGDHLVARSHVKTIDQLKGKKIALQRGGPHVGMLDDILRTAALSWKDVTVVWVDDITGDKGPAALFRKDSSIDACCVISPDMIGLSGGLESKGTGAEGTVRDASVLVSTNNMKRSIADVYACRKDFFDAHRDVVEKFAAGYLKASEEMLALRAEYEKKKSSAEYFAVLKLAQQIYGTDVLPTLEIDADGLVADCRYVGLPGNIAFFTEKNNFNGFEAKQRLALDLAVGQGYARARHQFQPPGFDYTTLASLGGLTRASATGSATPNAEISGFDAGMELDDRTIYAFTISFKPNQNTFSATQYGSQFERALEQASLFGNSIIAIRGHSDPTKTLRDLIVAGTSKGIIKRSGSPGNFRYFFQGRPLDLTDTQKIVELIEAGGFAGGKANPRETMQAALNLSRTRAEAVRDTLVKYGESKGINLNRNQFQPIGAGIVEPLIAKPRNMSEALQNMRVEFRIVNVPAETINPGDFDF